ncbi:UNKNOWN [Stylonychia lemnae]|uniref:Uncharacterized protein n=1 Tax=Stylonychia lemnae TaxID=5949 RepID=A0A078AXQ7_STYLE|nr:UNKNOWN [Stylonychia lemnae]|eukprot:CDW86939.1 UNKNOWN [Stylonychia lemnae]
MERLICFCGQKAHIFEIKLNRFIVPNTSNLPLFIKPLSQEAAFNKGVEYFVELVFFYGILITIAMYEIKSSQEVSSGLKKNVDSFESECKDAENQIGKLKHDISDCQNFLQQSNQEYKKVLSELSQMNLKLNRMYEDKEI